MGHLLRVAGCFGVGRHAHGEFILAHAEPEHGAVREGEHRRRLVARSSDPAGVDHEELRAGTALLERQARPVEVEGLGEGRLGEAVDVVSQQDLPVGLQAMTAEVEDAHVVGIRGTRGGPPLERFADIVQPGRRRLY